ncbi:MAG TPA: bacillithiol system redox-active protein YtxJ [Phnomibacter sp.]|nr:bacillithiol system redox-active protein YtxJ [Phnomibacter sp.]
MSNTWQPLTSAAQLEELTAQSYQQPQLIYKHSTRCALSSIVWQRLQGTALPPGLTGYYLDLIAFRTLSNQIAEKFSVYHESPQVLLIVHGQCVYDESHMAIRMADILQEAAPYLPQTNNA